MRGLVRRLVAGASCLVTLGACLPKTSEPKPDPSVCVTPPTHLRSIEDLNKPLEARPNDPEGKRQAAARQLSYATECIHRWSYRLARSQEPAKVIGEAVVKGGCRNELAQAATLESEAWDEHRNVVANRMFVQQEHLATYYVTQARAGNCKAPD